MGEKLDPLSEELCSVMRDLVQLDFTIEGYRVLMGEIEGSPAHARALAALVRHHEVERLKCIARAEALRARLPSGL